MSFTAHQISVGAAAAAAHYQRYWAALAAGHFGGDQVSYNLRKIRVAAPPRTCDCCGSHEYVLHQSRQVCSYCRVPAA